MKGSPILKQYYPLYTTKDRYTLVTGGRGSGKSFGVADFILRLTFQKGEGVLYTRYTMASAEKSIIPEFRAAIERNGFSGYFNITKSKIVNQLTGSFVLFSGIKTSSGDQTANLKSIHGVSTWVIEEMEDFNDEEAFNRINESIRTKDAQNRVIMIMNPSYRSHFVYQRFILPDYEIKKVQEAKIEISNVDNVTHIHTTCIDIEDKLGEDFVKEYQKLRINKNEEYNHRFLGQWQNVKGGLVIEDWEQCNEIPQHLPYAYGIDYGFSPDPTAIIKVAYDSKLKHVYLEEQLVAKKLDTETIASFIHDNLNRQDMFVCETAEPRLNHELRKKNINVVEFKKPKLAFSLNELIQNKIFIVKGSLNIMNEANLYEWNSKKAGIPVDANNHCIDAARYAFNKLKNPSRIVFI